jgi:hypothetical protein
MISRRKILKGGAAAAVIASVPFINTRRAFAQSALPFNYFISPIGDDNNEGSLASPWSITALNSKMSTYSGKRVGIIGDIGGTQTPITYGTIGGVKTTLYSIVNTQQNQPALNTEGGTSGASTYIASCNSSGVYTPRWAIIDCSNPVGGAKPTLDACILMGQNSESSTQVPHPGYITFDGLTIRNFSYCAIQLSNHGGALLQKGVIQNCEIYNGGGVVSNNNPGAIRFDTTFNATVTNCKIHDAQTIPGGADPQWGYNAVMQYGTGNVNGSTGLIVTHCTFYNISSILVKDGNTDFADCSYNYMDHGIFGSAQAGGDLDDGAITGLTPYTGTISLIHHNIMMAGLEQRPQSGTPLVTGTTKFYNNTLYGTSAFGSNFDAVYCPPAGTGAALQFYRNIVYAVGGYNTSAGAVWVHSTYAIANATFNNNVYGSNSNPLNFALTEYSPLSFTSWKSTTGCDQNSVQVSTPPFTGTPTALSPSSFTVNSSAVIGGVTCGALDGSGLVGCDFAGAPTPVPVAPTLKVN